ncbi:MAG TPA: immunoglobulin domain-containing protein, partial [Candidatus Sulfotelmatobacter sp.]|nr:immunoglobulin domain-containing protein [Candidatus Sulfotelmatobacter sp.]
MKGIPKKLVGWLLLLGLSLTLGTASRAQTLGEVLNATNLTWTASSWTVQTNIAHDAIASARLGGGYSIPAEAWLQTTVTGMTAITFWWRVSCCADAYLDFSVGGVPQGRISGQVDWQQRSFWVPEGTQTLRWRYTASCLSSAATNAGWLDEVGFSEPAPPAIVQGPTNQTVATADAVVLRAQAAGTEPWWWQWRLNGSDLPGATNAWLAISNVQPANAGNYTVVLTTPLGAVTSQVATLTVVPSPPLFTLQPLSQSNILGCKITFSAAAKGLEPLLWQWYFNQQPLPSATNSTLVITNLQVTNAGDYTVVVRNELEAVTSQIATLSVILAPLWTKQPASQAAPAGATVSFSASVQGSGTLGWQWYFEGQALPGATSPVLRVTDVTAAKHGAYWVVVTNAFGSATSAVATLSYSPVVVWGYGETLTNVPPGATNIVALAGGDAHNLALREDGT